MAVNTASVVDLDVYNLVVGNCRLVGVGPVLGTISCEDPSTKYDVLGVSCGGFTVGRVCVNVGPIDTGLNLGIGP